MQTGWSLDPGTQLARAPANQNATYVRSNADRRCRERFTGRRISTEVQNPESQMQSVCWEQLLASRPKLDKKSASMNFMMEKQKLFASSMATSERAHPHFSPLIPF